MMVPVRKSMHYESTNTRVKNLMETQQENARYTSKLPPGNNIRQELDHSRYPPPYPNSLPSNNSNGKYQVSYNDVNQNHQNISKYQQASQVRELIHSDRNLGEVPLGEYADGFSY